MKSPVDTVFPWEEDTRPSPFTYEHARTSIGARAQESPTGRESGNPGGKI